MIPKADLSYLAAVLDTQGIITTRAHQPAPLPLVAIHGPNMALLEWVSGMTGSQVSVIKREYAKAGCAQHCAEKHQHIQSVSGRWSVTGVKATIVLHNLVPLMRFQRDYAQAMLTYGLGNRVTKTTVDEMRALGWRVPTFVRVPAAEAVPPVPVR